LSKLGARTAAKPGAVGSGVALAAVLLAVACLVLFGLFWLLGGVFAPTVRAAGPVPGLPGTSHAV
jgi:hypothetical protein